MLKGRRDFLRDCGALWIAAQRASGEVPARIFIYAQRQTPMRSALDVTCNGTGDETFVRINWNQHVSRSPIPVLSVVPADRARQEMKFLSYIAAKNIRSDFVERRDPRTPEEPTLKRR